MATQFYEIIFPELFFLMRTLPFSSFAEARRADYRSRSLYYLAGIELKDWISYLIAVLLLLEVLSSET